MNVTQLHHETISRTVRIGDLDAIIPGGQVAEDAQNTARRLVAVARRLVEGAGDPLAHDEREGLADLLRLVSGILAATR